MGETVCNIEWSIDWDWYDEIVAEHEATIQEYTQMTTVLIDLDEIPLPTKQEKSKFEKELESLF